MATKANTYTAPAETKCHYIIQCDDASVRLCTVTFNATAPGEQDLHESYTFDINASNALTAQEETDLVNLLTKLYNHGTSQKGYA